jgi:chemotaxis protein MotA
MPIKLIWYEEKNQRMRSSTLFGIILGFAAIFGAFLMEGGPINSLFMFPAMLIVFGGTLAAGITGTSLDTVLKIPKLIKYSIFPPTYDKIEIINQIVGFATIARKEGLLSIESKLGKIQYPFLKKILTVCIDGADPDSFQTIVQNELHYINQRHNHNIQLFVKLGGYSPTMGIIGTVMGLIATLAAAGSDPNVLIQHIATAFIATMWGIFMANIVWLPIGDKLKTLHDQEMQLFQMMIDGVHSVQIGETPMVIRSKLVSIFPLSEQEKILKDNIKVYKPSLVKAPGSLGLKPTTFPQATKPNS